MKRLGIPKSRGELILWVANLAVNGALKYRWGNEYWRWKGMDSGLISEPLPISVCHPVNVREDDRLVRVASAGQPRTL